jgi:hypothetical protein
MSRKVAVVLRGPPGAGKSNVANALQVLYPKNSRVELDRFWGDGQQRFLGNCRYWDLSNQADLLIIELGFGEPVGEVFPGATKNPREWIAVLERDNRIVLFFYLEVSEAEALSRVAQRVDLSPSYAKLADARYQPGGVCSSKVFSALIGSPHSEEVIDTEKNDLASTVARIVTKIGSL